jgi:hypothetical protein
LTRQNEIAKDSWVLILCFLDNSPPAFAFAFGEDISELDTYKAVWEGREEEEEEKEEEERKEEEREEGGGRWGYLSGWDCRVGCVRWLGVFEECREREREEGEGDGGREVWDDTRRWGGRERREEEEEEEEEVA